MVEINNFLNQQECLDLIKMIDDNHHPSSVVEGGNNVSSYSSNRTSSTCNLNHNHPQVQAVHQKIANYLGLDILKGEHLQGQLYEVGQYFKAHQDFFSGPAYDKHCLASGNRTHTFMIYLNCEFEGGGTKFTNLNKVVSAETGKALTWENMKDGVCLDEAMHEGMPVTKGKKYIITSWWRENHWRGAEDAMLYSQKPKQYTDKSQIPRLTEKGFKVIKVPQETWSIINDAYRLLQNTVKEEVFEGKEHIIIGGGSEFLSFDEIPSIKNIIHQQLLPIHREFAGVDIEPSFVYGIRSYLKNATLVNHVDRVETHHVSSIIVVDKDLRCGCQNKEFGNDWALDIQDHQGVWHKVYAEPGDMILYESATCEHGRAEPFQGNYYRNFYVHYKLI